jgi:hypothetical protein
MLKQQTTRLCCFKQRFKQYKLENVPVLIKKKSILKNISNYRLKNKKETFNRLDDNEIPEIYKLTNYGPKFIYYDKTELNERIIILITRENLKHLEQSKIWLCDGFSMSPPWFYKYS